MTYYAEMPVIHGFGEPQAKWLSMEKVLEIMTLLGMAGTVAAGVSLQQQVTARASSVSLEQARARQREQAAAVTQAERSKADAAQQQAHVAQDKSDAWYDWRDAVEMHNLRVGAWRKIHAATYNLQEQLRQMDAVGGGSPAVRAAIEQQIVDIHHHAQTDLTAAMGQVDRTDDILKQAHELDAQPAHQNTVQNSHIMEDMVLNTHAQLLALRGADDPLVRNLGYMQYLIRTARDAGDMTALTQHIAQAAAYTSIGNKTIENIQNAAADAQLLINRAETWRAEREIEAQRKADEQEALRQQANRDQLDEQLERTNDYRERIRQIEAQQQADNTSENTTAISARQHERQVDEQEALRQQANRDQLNEQLERTNDYREQVRKIEAEDEIRSLKADAPNTKWFFNIFILRKSIITDIEITEQYAEELLNDTFLTDLERLATLSDYVASKYPNDSQSYLRIMTHIINGVPSGPLSPLRAVGADPCSGWGRDPSDCPENGNLGRWIQDSGYHTDFQDGRNQVFHFWASVDGIGSSAVWGSGNGPFDQLGLLISRATTQVGLQDFHEGIQSNEDLGPLYDEGASYQDYLLTQIGMAYGHGLATGEIQPYQMGDSLRLILSNPYPTDGEQEATIGLLGWRVAPSTLTPPKRLNWYGSRDNAGHGIEEIP